MAMQARLQTSIRFKLAMLVTGAVVVTAGALSWISYIYAHGTLRQEIHARLSVIASDRQKLLLSYIHQQQERVNLVASRTRLRQLLADGLADEAARAEARRILEDAMSVATGVRAIWIADPNGRVVVATDDARLGQDFSAETEFLDGRSGPQVYLRPEEHDANVALLSAPATIQPDNRLVGVVMMLTDAREILGAIADRRGLGHTGEVMVGARANDHIKYLVLGESGTSTVDVPLQSSPAMAAAVAGESGFKETFDRRGVGVLAAYNPAGYRNWGIVTKIDTAEAYAPIAWLRRAFISVAGVALVWGVVISFLLARRFTRPILRMAGMAESIASGGLHARVVVEEHDEVGRLGEAFNRMTEELAHSHAILEERVKERTAQLRQSQEHTRQIIETAHEAFVAISSEGILTDWNHAAEVLFGWTREEILGRRIAETIIPVRYREAHQRGLERFLATGEAPVLNRRIEMPALRRDGTEFLAELTIVPVRVGDRQMFNAFLHDISARKQAEDAVAYERHLLQSLMDHSPDRIYFKDLKSRFVRANKATAAFFGVADPSQLVGRTDADYFSTEHARLALEDEQNIVRTGTAMVSKQERETWPDGRVTWASTSKVPWRDAAGNVVGTFGISRDVTDRVRAEELLNQYFQLSPDLFCIADAKGYFQRVNAAWTAVLGYSEEEMRREPFIRFVHPEDRDATMAEFEKLLKGRRVLQFENRYRSKDGSYRWLQWNAIPVPDEQIIHAVARDVSEHKRAQELLARFADALNRKNLEIQEDLKMAREVHQVFLAQGYPVFPRGARPETSALRFTHRYLPTSALGGDFFEILQLSDAQAGIFICDVMGHGMRAALVTSILRGLIDKYRNNAPDPDRLLAEINHALMTNLKTVGTTIFATAAYVVFDATTGQLRYANAGHPSPFVLRRATKKVERLEGQVLSRSPALGLLRDATYPVTNYKLQLCDSLLLFTDGLYEVESADGQQFGFERLQEAVSRRVGLADGQLLDELLLEVRQHATGGEFTDDVCLVEVELAGKLAG